MKQVGFKPGVKERENPAGNVLVRPSTSEEWPKVQSDGSGIAGVVRQSIAIRDIVVALALTFTTYVTGCDLDKLIVSKKVEMSTMSIIRRNDSVWVRCLQVHCEELPIKLQRGPRERISTMIAPRKTRVLHDTVPTAVPRVDTFVTDKRSNGVWHQC